MRGSGDEQVRVSGDELAKGSGDELARVSGGDEQARGSGDEQAKDSYGQSGGEKTIVSYVCNLMHSGIFAHLLRGGVRDRERDRLRGGLLLRPRPPSSWPNGFSFCGQEANVSSGHDQCVVMHAN